MREQSGKTYQTAFVEPLHLQVTCERLWQRLPEGTVEVKPEAVDTAGAVGDALAAYYRDAVRETACSREAVDLGCDERAIRDWFENELISPAGLRDQLQRGADATGKLPNPVVEVLEAHYLVRSELRRGTLWYEIAHDRLIEAIKADNQVWYDTQAEPLRILRTQADKWERRRDQSALLADQQLADVEAWAARNPKSLSEPERRFLEACRDQQAKRATLRRLRRTVAAAVVVTLVLTTFMARRLYNRNNELKRTLARMHVHKLLSDSAEQRWRRDDEEQALLLALQAERSSHGMATEPRCGRGSRRTCGASPRSAVRQHAASPSRRRRDGRYAQAGLLPRWPGDRRAGENEHARGHASGRRLRRLPRAVAADVRCAARARAEPSGRYLVAVTDSGVRPVPARTCSPALRVERADHRRSARRAPDGAERRVLHGGRRLAAVRRLESGTVARWNVGAAPSKWRSSARSASSARLRAPRWRVIPRDVGSPSATPSTSGGPRRETGRDGSLCCARWTARCPRRPCSTRSSAGQMTCGRVSAR